MSLSLEAFDSRRYDDLDLAIDLESEIRLASNQGFRWVRGARRIQIFAADPGESGLISVGAAQRGANHTVICRMSDVQAVQQAAAAVASPPPTPLNVSTNLPDGWTILADHIPQEPAAMPLPDGLTPLDPGPDFDISFDGGLAIRSRSFAEGRPPAISISPDPADSAVTIDDQKAIRTEAGYWVASGWDSPGRHLVNIVPGPSLAYEILPDPWASNRRREGANPVEVSHRTTAHPFTTRVCGASLRGPRNEIVLAATTSPFLTALGADGGAKTLQPRSGLDVSVALLPFEPAFLLAETGRSRTHAGLTWLGPHGHPPTAKPDPQWWRTVHFASVRRVPILNSDDGADRAWALARACARSHWKRR